MFNSTVENIGDDFHILVRMGSESATNSDLLAYYVKQIPLK